jgi:hypothetical protein
MAEGIGDARRDHAVEQSRCEERQGAADPDDADRHGDVPLDRRVDRLRVAIGRLAAVLDRPVQSPSQVMQRRDLRPYRDLVAPLQGRQQPVGGDDVGIGDRFERSRGLVQGT